MQMQKNRPMRIATLIFIVIALASCSTLPTAPSGPTQTSPPAVMTGDLIANRLGDDFAPKAPVVSLVTSRIINGSLGGVLSIGRWKVVVPQGAFVGVGTITITVPDTSLDRCDLSISPPSLNHFDEAVDLRFKCATMTEAKQRNMQWWNPSTGSWVLIESWPNDDDMTRCAPLQHFSQYASGGKAGW